MPHLSTPDPRSQHRRPDPRRLPIAVLGGWCLLFGLAVVSGAVALAATESTAVIGVATSLTTLEGRESLMAVELAVEAINRNGGLRIDGQSVRMRIETVDLQDAGAQVSIEAAVERLAAFLDAQPVHAVVVGPFRSEVFLPAMEVIASRRIPMISTIAMSPAMESKVMKSPAYRYLFRTGLNTRYLADCLIESMRFLNRQYGFHRVYLMIQDVAWARSTASLMVKFYFERTGWQVLGIRAYPSEATDFSDGLREATDKAAQVIVPIFDTPHSAQLVIAWNTRRTPGLLCGFISPMIGPSAWDHFQGQIGGALNVVFELGNIPSARYPPAERFYRAFQERYGRQIEAGHGPAPSHEAVYLLAEAMQAAASLDADRIVAALVASDRLGAMGRLRFNQGHQVIFGTDPQEAAVACLIQWRPSGRRVIVYPPALAEDEIALPSSVPP